MTKKGANVDFYFVYAKTGGTLTRCLCTKIRRLAAPTKLDIVDDPPETRLKTINGCGAAAVLAGTDEDCSSSLVCAGRVVLVITPGLFECPVCAEEVALVLTHKRPLLLLQHLRACPVLWQELDKAPNSMRRVLLEALWQKIYPICPYLVEYDNICAAQISRLCDKVPRTRLPEIPSVGGICTASRTPGKVLDVVMMLEGRTSSIIYGKAGTDICDSLKYVLNTVRRGRTKIYAVRVAGGPPALPKEPDTTLPPFLNGGMVGTSALLPRISNSRGLLRTWSDVGPMNDVSLADQARVRQARMAAPNLETSVAVLLVVVTRGVLADKVVQESLAAASACPCLILIQDIRTVPNLAIEMQESGLPTDLRLRLADAPWVPYVFEYGAAAVFEHLIFADIFQRLSSLQPRLVDSKSSRDSGGIFFSHTCTAEGDWAYILKEELIRLMIGLPMYLDIGETRDQRFVEHVVCGSQLVVVLTSTGFLVHPWARRLFSLVKGRRLRIAFMQPLDDAVDIERELLICPEVRKKGHEKEHLPSWSGLLDKGTQKLAEALYHRRGAEHLMHEMPLITFTTPAIVCVNALKYALAVKTSHRLQSRDHQSTSSVLCTAANVMQVLKKELEMEAGQINLETLRGALCTLANLAFFGASRQDNTSIMVNQGISSLLMAILSAYKQEPDVVIQALRLMVNICLGEHGFDFLEALIKEDVITLLDELAQLHVANKTSHGENLIQCQLSALYLIFMRYEESRKAWDVDRPVAQGQKAVMYLGGEGGVGPEWAAQLAKTNLKVAQLQAALVLREALAAASATKPPKGYDSAIDAPGILHKLFQAFNRCQDLRCKSVDPSLWKTAREMHVPCEKHCGWMGLLPDEHSHICHRTRELVVPTNVSSIQEAVNLVERPSSSSSQNVDEDSIVVIRLRPHKYQETVVVDRPVKIIADGPQDKCIIEGDEGSAITFLPGANGSSAHSLTLRRRGGSQEAIPPVVAVKSCTATIQACDISSGDHGVGVCVSCEEDNRSLPRLIDNSIHHCLGGGLVFEGWTAGVAEGNKIQDNGTTGILLQGCAHPVCTGNQIHRNNGRGIWVQSSTQAGPGSPSKKSTSWETQLAKSCAVLQSNEIGQNTHAAIEISGGGHAEVRNNQLYESGKSGVRVSAGCRGRIHGNTVRSNGGSGIFLADKVMTECVENKVLQNQGVGIKVSSSTVGVIRDNYIYGNGAPAQESHGAPAQESHEDDGSKSLTRLESMKSTDKEDVDEHDDVFLDGLEVSDNRIDSETALSLDVPGKGTVSVPVGRRNARNPMGLSTKSDAPPVGLSTKSDAPPAEEEESEEEESPELQAIITKLPSKRTPEHKNKRLELWSAIDVNGNGIMSLSEISNGICDLLQLDAVVDCKPAIMKAFDAAKDSNGRTSGVSEDYVERNEFVIFFDYLHKYFKLYFMYKEIDINFDGRVSFAEFSHVKSQKRLERWGISMTDPQATFNSADKDGGGMVLFDEFADWAIKQSLSLDPDSPE